MEDIRVTRIQVEKLFNEINYDIHMDDDKPVGILIAPNGCGKTTILKLLSFVLFPAYEAYLEIKNIPFSKFECFLSNGKKIVLSRTSHTKRTNGKAGKTDSLFYRFFDGIHYENIEKKQVPDNDFEYTILSTNKNAEQQDRGKKLSNLLNMQDDFIEEWVPEKGKELSEISSQMKSIHFTSELMKYRSRMKCFKPVVFIETSRLQMETISERTKPRSIRNMSSGNPLENAITNIAKVIQEARVEYSEEVSAAKDRLPRLILQGLSNLPEAEAFQKKWNEYTEELRKLQSIGLIDHGEELIDDNEIPAKYEDKKEFLNAYLTAFMNTTVPLKAVYEKLNLFKKIFDERNAITHKTLLFGQKGALLFCNGKPLDFACLSSGEKHDFIMFYNLILNSREGSLVLVDEPEISLHIEWQESYLDRLIEICEMNHMQAIVATHSPNIVCNHYDCLLDKGEQYVGR